MICAGTYTIYYLNNSELQDFDYVLEAVRLYAEVSEKVFVGVSKDLSEEQEKLFDSIGATVVYVGPVDSAIKAYFEIIKNISFQEIICLKQLLLTNSDVYGPIFSLSSIIDSMLKKDIDFWGITSSWNSGAEYIQGYFIILNNSVLSSKDFLNLVKSDSLLSEIKTDVCLTNYLQSCAFRFSTYLSYAKDEYFSALVDGAFDSYRKGNPFVAKAIFCNHEIQDKLLKYSYGQIPNSVFATIPDNWKKLIQKDLISSYPQSIWMLQLLNVFVLSDEIVETKLTADKIALVVYVWFEENIEKIIQYIKKMPEGSSIYLVSSKKSVLDEYKKLLELNQSEKKCIYFREQPNRGRNESAYFVTCKDVFDSHDFVCLLHDKKIVQRKPFSLGENFFDHQLVNLLNSKEYVLNIVDTFNKNPQLGLMQPPFPLLGRWVSDCSLNPSKDANNYLGVTDKLRQDLDLHLRLDEELVYPMGGSFWIRSRAIKKFLSKGWSYDDFPPEPLPRDLSLNHALERLYPLIVQDAGYYSALIMNPAYVRTYVTTAFCYLRKLYKSKYAYVPMESKKSVELINEVSRIIIKRVIHKFGLLDYARKILALLRR